MQRRVDSYFVANWQMADELRRRLPRALVEVSGIPVDPALASAPTQRAARCGLQLDADRPVVLVMGGGFGLGVEAAANAALAARTPGLQVLVVCGRNAAAQRRLTQTAAELPELSRSLHVVGFVNDVDRYMAAADLIVTKPGGLTTSESLALSRPLLLTRGMPGHEEANVRFLTAIDAALATPTGATVSAGVERFFDDAHVRASLRSGAALAATPFAAPRIAQAVLNRLAARAAA